MTYGGHLRGDQMHDAGVSAETNLAALGELARLFRDGRDEELPELLGQAAVLVAGVAGATADCAIRYGSVLSSTSGFSRTRPVLERAIGTRGNGEGSLALALPPAIEAGQLSDLATFMNAAADLLGGALEQRGAEEALRRSETYLRHAVEAAHRERDRTQLLLEVGNALVSQLESHPISLSALSGVRRVIPLDFAELAIVDRAGGTLRVEAATFYDERGVLEPHTTLALDRSPCGLAYRTGEVRVFGPGELDRFQGDGVPLVRAEGIRSLCCLPLHTHRGPLGALGVGRRAPEGFSADETNLLRDLAAQVAIAVANTLAYQEIAALRDQLTEQKLYLEDEITERDFREIVGQSRALSQVLQQVRTVAPTDATVLLLGETGTGKELLARAIHELSRRRTQTFVRVNAAAMPATLIESELFGYERGAFTGAVARKVGRLELAERGTLFLDEVGDIPLEVQPKLLRALQEREFERLGGERTRQADVRFIAATNRRLEEMTAAGTFRGDLYYRLSVFPIQVPPLRERTEDIPQLVQHFVRKFSTEIGRTITAIPTTVMDALQAWPWPGNVRELANVIERAVILSPGPSLHVPASAFHPIPLPAGATSFLPGTVTFKGATRDGADAASYRDGEREMILRALREAGGQVGGPEGAAARLGLARTTLHSKMRRLGIVRPPF